MPAARVVARPDASSTAWCRAAAASGLGAATAARWLEIRWPSGRRQRVEALPVNDTVWVVEGEDGWTTVWEPALACCSSPRS
ncbi:MAG TPA: ASPIC/UnbV domain-containing protein [Thermoanaerobaculia bacterium]